MSQEIATPELKEQFILRVKRNSELERIIESLEPGHVTNHDIIEATGVKGSPPIARKLDKWFDNIKVDLHYESAGVSPTHSVRYTHVMPNQVSVVTSDVNFSGGGAQIDAPSNGELEVKYRWPAPPPLLEPMDNFDKPKFYDIMRHKVVVEGKHISLEGPPSVGKDTAVEQLAAEEGVPLVTVGGDGGFRTRDLTGDQQLVGGTSFYNVGEYVTAAINGWWVLMTEVNAADPSALMFINRQLAAPHVVNLGGKAYPVHKNFRLFITYNHGLVGTRPLPQSFKDRFFPVKIPFFSEYQLKTRLEAMGWSHKPAHEMWNTQVVQYGMKMWEAYEQGKMRYQITTRRLKDALDLIALTDMDAKSALEWSVVGAIDNPIEAREAKKILEVV